jgi:6-phosphogluconolactonase/glucosamine-6-phosphate isomerase/deaminase
MNKQIFNGDQGLVQAVNSWCADRVERYSAKTLFLPTGSTPIPLFRAWQNDPPKALRGLRLSQLDEVITGPETGVFKRFFQDMLPAFSSQFMDFEKVTEGPELVILGIGMNGHVAFHEPGYPADLFRGEVIVADEDCDAMKMPRGTKADTYGTGSFLQAKAILLIARGSSKRALMEKLFNDPKADFPAAYLREHHDFTILMDEAAQP